MGAGYPRPLLNASLREATNLKGLRIRMKGWRYKYLTRAHALNKHVVLCKTYLIYLCAFPHYNFIKGTMKSSNTLLVL